MSNKDDKKETKSILNREANHRYFIEDTIEAGIVLQGTEVKSLRKGNANLKDAYVVMKNEEVYLINLHISPYDFGNRFNHDPLRSRKLLLKKSEIFKHMNKLRSQGMTAIPLKIYFNQRGYAKVLIGIAKPKNMADKRNSSKERDAKMEMSKALKRNK